MRLSRRKKGEEDFAAEVQKSFDRWEYLHTEGGSDPFWSDGVNLNLVRNHICYYKAKIKENHSPQNYPAVYHQENPPEVSRDYMARADQIRERAKSSLALYEQDKNYQYLLDRADLIDPKEEKKVKLYVKNLVNYAKGLEDAIVADDLVTMRRHENPAGYLQSFKECVQRLSELKSSGQISLFSLIENGRLN